MLSSVFIALLQAAAGDPATVDGTTEPAPVAAEAPRTERRRVCRRVESGTGRRIAERVCRYEEAPVEESAPAATQDTPNSNPQSGGASLPAPAPTAPADEDVQHD